MNNKVEQYELLVMFQHNPFLLKDVIKHIFYRKLLDLLRTKNVVMCVVGGAADA